MAGTVITTGSARRSNQPQEYGVSLLADGTTHVPTSAEAPVRPHLAAPRARTGLAAAPLAHYRPNVAETADLRSVAREAYTFGYPMVENYRTLYAQAVDSSDPRYTGG